MHKFVQDVVVVTVSRSGGIILCARSEDYKAKIWLKLSSCLWSLMVLKSVKIGEKSSSYNSELVEPPY